LAILKSLLRLTSNQISFEVPFQVPFEVTIKIICIVSIKFK